MIISVNVSFIIFVAFLAFFLTFFPVITRTQIQNSMANELSRYIEVKGEVSSATSDEFERLKESAGISDAEYNIVASYIPGTKKIALDTPFEVVITSDTEVGVGGIFSVPIPVVSKAAGRGERYWK